MEIKGRARLARREQVLCFFFVLVSPLSQYTEGPERSLMTLTWMGEMLHYWSTSYPTLLYSLACSCNKERNRPTVGGSKKAFAQ